MEVPAGGACVCTRYRAGYVSLAINASRYHAGYQVLYYRTFFFFFWLLERKLAHTGPCQLALSVVCGELRFITKLKKQQQLLIFFG